MSTRAERADCSRQVVIEMKTNPSKRGQNGFCAFHGAWNGICGVPHLLSSLSWRSKSGESLGYGCVRQVDLCSIECRIQFNGAGEVLDAVLHAMTLKRLPFVMATKKELVSFPSSRGPSS